MVARGIYDDHQGGCGGKIGKLRSTIVSVLATPVGVRSSEFLGGYRDILTTTGVLWWLHGWA